ALLLAAGRDLDLRQLAHGRRAGRQQRDALPRRLRGHGHQVADLVGRAVVARVEGRRGRALPLLGAVLPGRLATLAREALGHRALVVLVAVDGERRGRAVGAEDQAAVDLGAAATVVVLEVAADRAVGFALDGEEAGVVAHDAAAPALRLGGGGGDDGEGNEDGGGEATASVPEHAWDLRWVRGGGHG